MKGKKISKVLAIMLAFAMIFTTLPLMAFASDETESYIVSYGSPAIPMTAGAAVKLSEIMVNLDEQIVTLAETEINIADTKNVAISGDYLIAFEEGTYKLTATYGGVSKTIWVVAANETDATNNKYYLLNETFDDGTYDPDEWGVTVSQKDVNTAYYIKEDGTKGNTEFIQGKWYNSLYYQNGIFVDATAFEVQEVTALPSTGKQKIIYKLTADNGDYTAGLYAWHFGKYIKADQRISTDGTKTVIHYYVPAVFAYSFEEAIEKQLLNSSLSIPAKHGATIPFRTSRCKDSSEYDALLDANGNVAYKEDGVTPIVNSDASFTGSGFFYSKSPIFNDFSDYTLETSVALVERVTHHPNSSTNAAYSQIGPVARLTYNDARVNNFASFNISYRWANGGKLYYSYSSSAKSLSAGEYSPPSSPIFTGIMNVNDSVTTSADNWNERDNIFVVSRMVASGNTVKLEKMENRSGTKVAITETYVQNTTVTNKGTVGVVLRNEGAPAVDYIKVTLNADILNNKPAVYDPPIYSVDDNTPVVPMTAHSSTSLANIRINFGGNAVVANAADWVSKSNQLKFEGGNAIVYGAGTYTATATYNGVSKTIYFVAKNADDEHYVVYSTDFDRDVGNDWHLYNSSYKELDPRDFHNDTTNYEMFNGFVLNQNYYLMLDNEVIRNLRDYTMSIEFGGNYTAIAEDWRAFYLIGRADTLVPNEDFNTNMLGFVPRTASTKIRLFRNNKNFVVNILDTAEKDYVYTLGNLVEATVYMSDKHVVATIDGTEIYDTEKDTSTSADKMNNIYAGKGNVGIKTSMNYTIKHYEVRLNPETVAGAPACAPINNVLTNNTLYMTEGTRLNMADIELVFENVTISGDKAKWSYVRNNTVEVSDFFDTVCAFTAGTENITATYNGQTINIAIVVEKTASVNTFGALDSMIKTDGNGTAIITPVADDNYAYQIAVTPKDGYVVDTDKSNVYSYKKAIKMLGRTDDSTGNTLVADFDALDDVVVNLCFKAEKIVDVTMIGSTIRYADAEKGLTNGIRFGMRSYNVKNANIDTVIVDGVEYKVAGVGMAMLPKPLLDGELTVNSANVAVKMFDKVVDYTENYADFALTLTDLPDDYLTLDIVSRGFIKYIIPGENETYGYYYADEMTSSFDTIEQRIETAEIKYDFYYDDFDKGYITLVYDDNRGDLGTVFNIFEKYNVPLVAAIPPETVSSNNVTLLRNIQAAGGEIIGHHFGVLTSKMTSQQKYDQLKETYDTLTGNGLNVNGYILAGGTGQDDINRKEIETMLRKLGFSYSDLYGISPNYYHPRSSMSADNDASIYNKIGQAAANNTWQSFYAHDLKTERTEAQLCELIEYIQANPDVEIVTYKYIYQNFGNFRNPVNWNNAVTQ